MKLTTPLLAFALAAPAAFGAGLPNTTSLRGEYVEARTADVYTGPCFANSEVGLTGNLAVFGWHIKEGQWQGVALNNLSVVGVVRANSTLGDIHTVTYPVKAVLIVDEKATPEQRLALQAFARKMGGELLQDVVRVESQPISLAFAGDNVHSAKATLQAGSLAKIETRAIREGDHICRNEEAWYLPLTKLKHAMPAYAVAHSFQGKGLNESWSNPDKRSAYVGTFQYAE